MIKVRLLSWVSIRILAILSLSAVIWYRQGIAQFRVGSLVNIMSLIGTYRIRS